MKINQVILLTGLCASCSNPTATIAPTQIAQAAIPNPTVYQCRTLVQQERADVLTMNDDGTYSTDGNASGRYTYDGNGTIVWSDGDYADRWGSSAYYVNQNEQSVITLNSKSDDHTGDLVCKSP